MGESTEFRSTRRGGLPNAIGSLPRYRCRLRAKELEAARRAEEIDSIKRAISSCEEVLRALRAELMRVTARLSGLGRGATR